MIAVILLFFYGEKTMTIKEAIDRLDGLKPNQYETEDKVKWLSDLDFRIYRDVILTHEHDEDIKPFKPYTVDDLGKKLIVDDPYTEVYTAYLKMKIDEENAETARYNNSAILFNAYYDDFAKYWNKTYLPINKSNIRFF